MLKFLSKVVVEYCPLDPRKAAAVELLAQCNGRKAKDSNPACSVELRRLPSPPHLEDPKSQQPLPPPRVVVTYLNGAEEAIVASDGVTAQGIRDQILARGRLIDTEHMFRDGAMEGRNGPLSSPRRSSACRSRASSRRNLTWEDNVKRGRGRSNLTWEESVKRDLKDWNITKDLAMDRGAWKLAIHVPEP